MHANGADAIFDVIEAKFRPLREGERREDLPLGGNGFGLDSIGLVELLMACEDHFGVEFPSELLLKTPLTIGTLADHVRQSQRGEASSS